MGGCYLVADVVRAVKLWKDSERHSGNDYVGLGASAAASFMNIVMVPPVSNRGRGLRGLRADLARLALKLERW